MWWNWNSNLRCGAVVASKMVQNTKSYNIFFLLLLTKSYKINNAEKKRKEKIEKWNHPLVTIFIWEKHESDWRCRAVVASKIVKNFLFILNFRFIYLNVYVKYTGNRMYVPILSFFCWHLVMQLIFLTLHSFKLGK